MFFKIGISYEVYFDTTLHTYNKLDFEEIN